MPCICKGMWVAGSIGGNSKKDISIESNWQELDFLKRYLVIIQISQFVGGMYGEWHNTKAINNTARRVGRLGEYKAIDWEIYFGDLIEEGVSNRHLKENKTIQWKQKMQKCLNIKGKCWKPCAPLSQS
jgi:hypothetical protein